MTYAAVPLIPRNVLFGNPERIAPTLSPDGTRLGFVAPVDGVLNVWIGPADDASAARPITHDRGRGIRTFAFCHDDRTLVYLQDTDGNEDWRLYAIDLDAPSSAKLLTPETGVTVTILEHNRWHPQSMLIGLNADNPELHDIYHLDLATSALEKVETNPGYAGWLIDSDLKVRGGVAMTEDGGAIVYRREEDGADKPWISIPSEDIAATDVHGFNREGTAAFVLSSISVNASRLLRVDLATGEETVLAEDPHYDVAGIAFDPHTREPQAVTFEKERTEWTYLDAEFGEEIDRLSARFEGELGLSRPVRDDRRWLVSDVLSDGPVRYYVYDRDSEELTFLFAHKPQLDEYELAPMEPFSFTARDGLTIHGYMTFPPEAERVNLPAVVNVHGGPWVRDSWGYDAEAQWLANRGYVCVQVNYRGSTGYGKDFGNAGNKQWGKAMHTDLLDAVDYLAGKGFVDSERVGIYGGSYGGYAALAGAAFTPDVFRCAVDLVGPSNLLTLLASIPEYWKPQLAFMHSRVGNPETEQDMLWERSPLSAVDQIKIPVLVAQGKNDPRVKVAEAEQIVNALVEKGLDHEYLLFEDEGHGLAKPENRERFYAATESFLATHLGGRRQDKE